MKTSLAETLASSANSSQVQELFLKKFAHVAGSPDGIKKLRELILQLAVQGKLVPQDPKDEPASVLLEKIKAEKERLIKEKKIKKAKVAPGYDMPEVNNCFPHTWALASLADLLVDSSNNIVDGPFGSKLKATEYVDKGVPIIRIQNIGRSEFKNNGLQYLTTQKAKELNRHNFIAGDIVLNKLGEPTGKVCIVPDTLSSGIIVADIIRIRLDESLQDKHFIDYCMNAPFVAKQFFGLAKGVTRQRVNLSQVRALSIPLPPLAEQKRIVTKVDQLMDLCDQLEEAQAKRTEANQILLTSVLNSLHTSSNSQEFDTAWKRLADNFATLFPATGSIRKSSGRGSAKQAQSLGKHNLQQLRQTILQLAVQGKLVPQDPNDEPASVLLEKIKAEKDRLVKEKVIRKSKPLDAITENEQPFNLPNSWRWVKLNEIGDWGAGSTPKRGNSELYDGDINWYKSGELNGAIIDYDSVEKVSELALKSSSLRLNQIGDVLIAMYGATIGKTAILAKTGTTNQAVCACTCFEGYGNDFLHILLKAYKRTFTDQGAGGAQPNISRIKIINTVAPLPPLAEQKRIVAKVDQLMAICDQLENTLDTALATQQKLTTSLIHHLEN